MADASLTIHTPLVRQHDGFGGPYELVPVPYYDTLVVLAPFFRLEVPPFTPPDPDPPFWNGALARLNFPVPYEGFWMVASVRLHAFSFYDIPELTTGFVIDTLNLPAWFVDAGGTQASLDLRIVSLPDPERPDRYGLEHLPFASFLSELLNDHGRALPISTELEFAPDPTPPPPNDHLADAVEFSLVGSSTRVSERIWRATFEPGEPVLAHEDHQPRPSLWWKVTVPRDGTLRLSTSGSRTIWDGDDDWFELFTAIEVFVDDDFPVTSFGTLTLAAVGVPVMWPWADVELEVTEDTTYFVRVTVPTFDRWVAVVLDAELEGGGTEPPTEGGWRVGSVGWIRRPPSVIS